MTENIRRLYEVISRSGDGKYQPAQATGVLAVASVERDSTGAIVAATGTLDGAGEFTVPLKGHSAAPGDFLLVGYPASQPVGAELAYLRHVASDNPGAGLVIVDGNLPAPTGLGITSAIVATPGSITATAVIAWAAVPDKYQPSGYIISYRIGGGGWDDRAVSHIGGAQQVEVKGLPPGATIDAHARARYNYANADSPPTADVSGTLAADTGSAGTVTALSYDVAVPNQVVVTPTVTVTPALFRGMQYEINDAATGSPDITTVPVADPGPYALVLPPGTYYAAARTVSKSGTLGTRFPSTGFNGPFTIIDQSANLDTTAPGAIGAPTLATATVQFADNTWHGFLTVTRPSYSPPSDLAAYEISVVVDDGRNWIAVEPVQAGVTSWKYEVGFGQFTVAMRGRDQAGNAPVFGSTAVATIAAPSFAGAAPTVTPSTVGAGIKVDWTAVTNARHYEVQRATSSGGAGATTVATVDSLWYFDTLTSDTVILPTYWYRVRGVGVANGAAVNGTYSGWVSGTAGAVDAQNLRALSIVAGLIAADAITANKILAGAVTAAKLTADLVLATLIRSATSGTRFEIEGATGDADQAQFRWYDTTHLRAIFQGAGLQFLNDSAAVRALHDGTGITIYYDSGRARATFDTSGITLYADQSGSPTVMTFGSGGVLVEDASANMLANFDLSTLDVLFNLAAGVMKIFASPSQYIEIGEITRGATSMQQFRLVGGNLLFSATASQGTLSGEWLEISNNGKLNFGTGTAAPVVDLERANDRFGNAYALHVQRPGSGKGAFVAGDIHSYRATTSNGIIWLGDGSGGDRYLLWNGTNYIMPGAQATINGVNVGSARITKRDIRRASFDLEKARALKPSRFRFVDDPQGTERVGFVAEDVAEAIPEIAVDLSDSLDHAGNPVFGGKGYSLEGLVAAQQAMIADLGERLAALEARGKP